MATSLSSYVFDICCNNWVCYCVFNFDCESLLSNWPSERERKTSVTCESVPPRQLSLYFLPLESVCFRLDWISNISLMKTQQNSTCTVCDYLSSVWIHWCTFQSVRTVLLFWHLLSWDFFQSSFLMMMIKYFWLVFLSK